MVAIVSAVTVGGGKGAFAPIASTIPELVRKTRKMQKAEYKLTIV